MRLSVEQSDILLYAYSSTCCTLALPRLPVLYSRLGFQLKATETLGLPMCVCSHHDRCMLDFGWASQCMSQCAPLRSWLMVMQLLRLG